MSTSEVETKALSMGWMPKEKFRGDPEKWVPADTFVERGETFVPYLKANNRKLEAKLNEAVSEVHSLKDMLKTNQEQIEALLAYNSEANKEKVQQQRKAITEGIKKAREEGDVETEEELRDQLAETRAALVRADERKTAPEVKPNGAALQPSPEVKAAFEAFTQNHDWYEQDHMMKSAFIGTMQTRMLDPEFAKLPVSDRFEVVAQEVETRFGQSARGPTRSKYEGSSGGGGPNARTTKEKGYAELPEEAKAGCERYASKLVGPEKGKTFKKLEDWQKKFAADYWRNNPNG
jgi:hypothetical protein